jgi:hypothetical protein
MLALAGITSPHGDDSSTIDIAADLGSVIESEQACGLTYDRDAIERFITEHVKASDMSFPSTFFDGPLHSNTSDRERIRIYKIGGKDTRQKAVQLPVRLRLLGRSRL